MRVTTEVKNLQRITSVWRNSCWLVAGGFSWAPTAHWAHCTERGRPHRLLSRGVSTSVPVGGGVTVRTLDLRSGRYQVVTTWMDDCLLTGEPSRYIANTNVT